MKRYRVLNIDFDSRADILNYKIEPDWPEDLKENWMKNKAQIEEEVFFQHGSLYGERKIEDLKALGSAPCSIIFYHNKFLRQIRDSFIQGAYYPALTGACALGERILNHLIINLKDEFKDSDLYKKVYNKPNFDDWNFAIKVLTEWKIFLPDTIENFNQLKDLRNRDALHFNSRIDSEDREFALKAINLISKIIQSQFPAFGDQPWFIESTVGEFYIKQNYENNPFIKKIYLPNCKLVGVRHRFVQRIEGGRLINDVVDNYNYKEKDISDLEFWNLRQDALINSLHLK